MCMVPKPSGSYLQTLSLTSNFVQPLPATAASTESSRNITTSLYSLIGTPQCFGKFFFEILSRVSWRMAAIYAGVVLAYMYLVPLDPLSWPCQLVA